MLIIQRPEVEAGEADGNTQSFVISPLEPGFGHTLGNSLRRALLSSIPGAAITQVRFDEALHEFDTIKGVKEDVTDLILNVKDLVLRCVSEEAVTLRLDGRGPGEMATFAAQLVEARPEGLLLVAQSNAGLPQVVGDHFEYDATPAAMAEHARDLQKTGIDLIGACCGSTPAHLAAMSDAVG